MRGCTIRAARRSRPISSRACEHVHRHGEAGRRGVGCPHGTNLDLSGAHERGGDRDVATAGARGRNRRTEPATNWKPERDRTLCIRTAFERGRRCVALVRHIDEGAQIQEPNRKRDRDVESPCISELISGEGESRARGIAGVGNAQYCARAHGGAANRECLRCGVDACAGVHERGIERLRRRVLEACACRFASITEGRVQIVAQVRRNEQ
jgi:hypothetical protein